MTNTSQKRISHHTAHSTASTASQSHEPHTALPAGGWVGVRRGIRRGGSVCCDFACRGRCWPTPPHPQPPHPTPSQPTPPCPTPPPSLLCSDRPLTPLVDGLFDAGAASRHEHHDGRHDACGHHGSDGHAVNVVNVAPDLDCQRVERVVGVGQRFGRPRRPGATTVQACAPQQSGRLNTRRQALRSGPWPTRSAQRSMRSARRAPASPRPARLDPVGQWIHAPGCRPLTRRSCPRS